MKIYKKIIFTVICLLPFFFPLLLQISGYELPDLGISETYYGIFVVIWIVSCISLDVILSKNSRDGYKSSFIVEILSLFIR